MGADKMDFLTATYTDVGIKKKTNQDSMLVMQADTDRGRVLFASVCDGMGGLAKGEVASATMIYTLRNWFLQRLPQILAEGPLQQNVLWSEWSALIEEASDKIVDYGVEVRVSLGTTAVVLLVIGNDYYIMNVGDSRIYLISDSIWQLTKDQTYVQREMDAGRMTPEQAMVDPQRSVLLQCIGASRFVVPDFSYGTLQSNQVFLLCCDGFRHVISPQEFLNELNPKVLDSKETMVSKLKMLTELNKQRREDDNISAILIKTL